jgi:hypothetical protein
MEFAFTSRPSKSIQMMPQQIFSSSIGLWLSGPPPRA